MENIITHDEEKTVTPEERKKQSQRFASITAINIAVVCFVVNWCAFHILHIAGDSMKFLLFATFFSYFNITARWDTLREGKLTKSQLQISLFSLTMSLLWVSAEYLMAIQ